MNFHARFSKKFISFVTVLLIGISVFTLLPQQTYAASAYIEITAGTVNVRSNAGTSYSVIGKVHKGNKFTYLSQKKASNGQKWYQIQFTGSKKGWVISKYAKYKAATATTAKTSAAGHTVKMVQITGSAVNIRSGAGTSYSKLATVKKGSRYDYLAQKKDSSGKLWYQIRLNASKKGWVIGRYSKIVTVTVSTSKAAASTSVTTGMTTTASTPVIHSTSTSFVTAAATSVQPDSTTATEPTSASSSDPDATTSTEPTSASSSDPDATTATDPASASSSDPDSTTATEPTSASSSDPDSTTATDPTSASSSDPDSTTASEPASTTDSTAATQPTSAVTTTTKPTSTTTKAATIPTTPAEKKAAAQKKVDAAAKKYGAVGVQVAVIKSGVVTDTYEYGYATKLTDKMTSDHKIRAASLSKVVVGMCAMKMQEEGTVSLDKNIGSYWGGSLYQSVTLRQLMSHKSYLKDNSYNSTKSGTLNQLKSSDCYRTSNGWSYNNYGMGIAGSTLEVASGKTLNSYAKDKFFTPLGIDAAFSTGNLSNTKLIATLYYPNDSVARSVAKAKELKQRSIGGNTAYFAGGLTVSAKDLAKLTAILANDGVYGGKKYLSAASVKTMETSQCSATSRGHTFKQCLPLRYQTDIYGQSKLYYHLGIAYGTLAYLGYNPDTRDGVVIITTGASQSYDSRGIWNICADIATYMYNN